MEYLSNSTLAARPETFLGIYDELSKYNVHLNIFERLWAVSASNASSCHDKY
jgi:methylsterol monooxygenase